MTHFVLTFYLIKPIANPSAVIKSFKLFMDRHDMKGRIYVNETGINAQLSILKTQACAFLDWYLSDVRFENTKIQKTACFEHAFPKKTVKYRKELVALGKKVDLSKRGRYLSAVQWQQMLSERDKNRVILDVRNHYEWEVGHFAGAEKPLCKTFSSFPHLVGQIKGKQDPKKTSVLMYCTGGIRCEFYSCLIKEQGYEKVYQLKGGVIGYGQEVGNAHWKGSLFVFDDRLVVPIAKQENEVISQCFRCKQKTNRYYNCANMQCNALILACAPCYQELLGCCSSACAHSPMRREVADYTKARPFRKLSWEEKQKGALPRLG